MARTPIRGLVAIEGRLPSSGLFGAGKESQVRRVPVTGREGVEVVMVPGVLLGAEDLLDGSVGTIGDPARRGGGHHPLNAVVCVLCARATSCKARENRENKPLSCHKASCSFSAFLPPLGPHRAYQLSGESIADSTAGAENIPDLCPPSLLS